ncbi:sialate O-acetylesterase [Dyadobacter jejuensis]|uniref:Sialate O-acetylesterase n=1 Tax=Dyadobacter jejuensis TaxID=1082580 RepID=A0A316B0D1_9BACT|nr:sialate O-acetylesterase [Dyadobacter jejuensis]PWJ55957.1 sialate O-acetylesterase [Dyadobacter jejuensis]
MEGKSQSGGTPVGAVKLASIFGSHMVLQQKEPIRIWGLAEADTPIYVQLGKEKQNTKADQEGKWLVTFPAREASLDPLILTVNNIRLEDIVIGEVWICSGQSNMQFPLKNMQTYQAVLKELPNNQLRLFNQTAIRIVAKGGYTTEELARCNPQDFYQGHWEPSTVSSASKASAVAWLFAQGLNQGLDVPIGIIQVALGGSAMNNWIPAEALKANPQTSSLLTTDWLRNESVKLAHRERAKDAFQHVLKPDEPYLPGQFQYRWLCEPGFLFEAGIAPLQDLSFRGVLWYQGESDTDEPEMVTAAKELFPMMVNAWRNYFDKAELPFVFVQLPGFDNKNWPAFREVQRLTQKQLSHTEMVVTLDLGEEKDIHPKDKQVVGERAAHLALKNVYELKNLLGFPELSKWRINGRDIQLYFKEFGKGFLPVEGPITGFEIAGQDGIFHRVKAQISGADTIHLQSTVESPQKLRYGWTPFPVPSLKLYNNARLPLGPFEVNFSN